MDTFLFHVFKKCSIVKTPWSDLVLMIEIGRTGTFYCFLYALTYSVVRNRHMYPQELTYPLVVFENKIINLIPLINRNDIVAPDKNYQKFDKAYVYSGP